MALSVGTPPPGTSRTEGLGTSSKVWVGIIFTRMSVSVGSTHSPTTTVRYSGTSSLTPVKIWSGPARSNTVSPGYRTKAMVFCWFCSSFGICRLLPFFGYSSCDGIERREGASAEQFLVEIGATGERLLQACPVLVQDLREPVPICLAPVYCAEGRLGIVLDYGLCALGRTLAPQFGYQL